MVYTLFLFLDITKKYRPVYTLGFMLGFFFCSQKKPTMKTLIDIIIMKNNELGDYFPIWKRTFVKHLKGGTM
jgi:hypothetical protein